MADNKDPVKSKKSNVTNVTKTLPVTTKQRHRETLLVYLSNPELPFPIRARYGDLLGITKKSVYDHFTPDDLSDLEQEAYAKRKSVSVRQRSNILKAMYDRAIGYHHAETHVATYEGKTILTPLIKRYPPDRSAAQEWLDRVEGKVTEKRDHTSSDGSMSPKEINVNATPKEASQDYKEMLKNDK